MSGVSEYSRHLLLADRRAKGLCGYCGAQPEPGQLNCDGCKARWRKNRAQSVANLKDTPEYKARIKGYGKKHAEKMSHYYRKRKYGISREEFEGAYQKQQGKCAICDRDLQIRAEKRVDKAFGDHCHVSGKFRGVLCLACNSGLSMLNDSPEIIASAIRYLQCQQS